MTTCTNEKCQDEATIQFDHCGKITAYCEKDWQGYKNIMNAIGSPIPVCYPIGTPAHQEEQ